MISGAEEVVLDDETVLRPALHHINLKTARLAEMIRWYGLVVGLTPNFRSERVAFLTNDAANHRVALISTHDFADDPDRFTRAGMHHSAFEYESLDDLLGSYARLKRQGILPVVCLDHGLTISFYYVDPDGNSVELQVDAYGDWRRSTTFLRTDARFVEDPIGPEIDPDALLRARLTGAALDELHERAYVSDFLPARPSPARLPN
jgi:catechol-2,3-dioxygenase